MNYNMGFTKISIHETIFIVKTFFQNISAKIDDVSAIELDTRGNYIMLLIGVLWYISSNILLTVSKEISYSLYYAILDLRAYHMIMTVLIFIAALFSTQIKIYVTGYKPIILIGNYISMKKLYESLKKDLNLN
ncbi:hypothetical protein HNP92_001897 [Methanococcus maripaludis]|uniref:Uncharacterized protein n=1 Tax=Methanococcus maripaludis TaxID=39152 RepID=A0A7J9P1U2_METMI|nr:hypothetical protein [Methanococcus maripaludis]MBA2853899.1 hypothetical protein [Methanococcus maripaludis]MBA2860095.1 hypothetical protein [Methanococcus maripaludis]MBA2863897.1 hypothetical protein [Methanococcus maripaludis]MBB6402574.1 hypothetical protein [Methanococcus maripaludis]MBB6496097.1 hypothetical protein [Methanococcus maripaludis]